MLKSQVYDELDFLINEIKNLTVNVTQEEIINPRISGIVFELLKSLKTRFNQSGSILPSYLKKKYKEEINKIESDLTYPQLTPIFTIFDDHPNDTYETHLTNPNNKTETKMGKDLSCKGFSEYREMNNEIIYIDHCIDSDHVIHGDCQSLRINFVHCSKIFVTGRVLYEVFISNCENVTLVTQCQQLRLNTVFFSSFLIQTSSPNAAVME
ncbi:hypothetical protein MXB_1157, partial [Myxobolus squamalis]